MTRTNYSIYSRAAMPSMWIEQRRGLRNLDLRLWYQFIDVIPESAPEQARAYEWHEACGSAERQATNGPRGLKYLLRAITIVVVNTRSKQFMALPVIP